MLASLQANDKGASNVRISFTSSGSTAATLSGDHPYYRETATSIAPVSVARIYHSGHKFDFALILSSAQGIRNPAASVD